MRFSRTHPDIPFIVLQVDVHRKQPPFTPSDNHRYLTSLSFDPTVEMKPVRPTPPVQAAMLAKRAEDEEVGLGALASGVMRLTDGRGRSLKIVS